MTGLSPSQKRLQVPCHLPTEHLVTARLVIELGDALSKERPLTQRESHILEVAARTIRRPKRGRIFPLWLPDDDRRLRLLVRQRMLPRQIAAEMGRSYEAVWKRIKRLGGVREIRAPGGGEKVRSRRVRGKG